MFRGASMAGCSEERYRVLENNIPLTTDGICGGSDGGRVLEHRPRGSIKGLGD